MKNILTVQDNMGPIIFIENLLVLALAKLGIKCAVERNIFNNMEELNLLSECSSLGLT